MCLGYLSIFIGFEVTNNALITMIFKIQKIVEDMVWSTRGLPCARLPWFSALRSLLVAAVPMERGASS